MIFGVGSGRFALAAGGGSDVGFAAGLLPVGRWLPRGVGRFEVRVGIVLLDLVVVVVVVEVLLVLVLVVLSLLWLLPLVL